MNPPTDPAVVQELILACANLLDYAEMRVAHDGSMTVDDIMWRLKNVIPKTGKIMKAHHIGCNQTTREVDLYRIRALLARIAPPETTKIEFRGKAKDIGAWAEIMREELGVHHETVVVTGPDEETITYNIAFDQWGKVHAKHWNRPYATGLSGIRCWKDILSFTFPNGNGVGQYIKPDYRTWSDIMQGGPKLADIPCTIEIVIWDKPRSLMWWSDFLRAKKLTLEIIAKDGKPSSVIKCQLTYRKWKEIYDEIWDKPFPETEYTWGQCTNGFSFPDFPRGIHPAGGGSIKAPLLDK